MSHDPFPGLRTPSPPLAARARILSRARQAALERPARRPLERAVDFVWSSRPLRLVWLAAVVLLAALNVTWQPGPAGFAVPPSVLESTELFEALGIESLRRAPEHSLRNPYDPAVIEALGV